MQLGATYENEKAGAEAGFNRFRVLGGTSCNSYMVPRGRLELPLLSKTDFESAASTDSATGAQWRRSIGSGPDRVNAWRGRVGGFPLSFAPLQSDSPRCVLPIFPSSCQTV